jgi:deoxyribodipyrimidine photo-lyase
MRPLVWFRSDLRRRDNTALIEACDAATNGVVAVFTVCPEQWRQHDWGAKRVNFLLRNLRDLSEGLARLNIPLKIITTPKFDGVPKPLLQLARQHECTALYFNKEYEVNEQRRDESVETLFHDHDLKVSSYDDQVIIPPGDVRTKEGRWYTVFTPFKKSWLTRFDDIGGVDVRRAPRKQAELDIKPDPVPDAVKGFDGADDRADLWPEGEAHAKRRLDAFIESRINEYDERRDAPAVNGTSTLSPYLTHGVLSPRECLEHALDVASKGGAGDGGPSVWISELIWREFYKHLLVGHPKLSMGRAFKPATERLDWNDDEDAFDAWREGRTGYPIVDAAMRQLSQTGWMHNRLRMVVAMFLTKDLFIDWRWGERHFMQTLVDGDVSSNNGGWQWSASTGTDAAPYFRIYNPVTQGQRHDPEAAFIKTFLPQFESTSAKHAHEPWTMPKSDRDALDYPERMVDHDSARERAIEAFKALS